MADLVALQFGNSYDDDMEDVTAQLESALHGPFSRDSHDGGLGYGDAPHGTEMCLDRYKHVAEGTARHSNEGAHHIKLSLHAPGAAGGPSYHTYGPLADPPSYEDSVLYPAPHAHLFPPSGGGDSSSAAEVSSAGKQDSKGSSGGGTSISGNAQVKHSGACAVGSGGGRGLGTSPLRPSLREQLLSVSISDPVKREQVGLFGLKGSYVTYLVRTTTQLPGFTLSCEGGVRRRFRDFVALADQLKVRYRGYFLPPRPEKNAVEGQRQTDAFVEERRVALERYINRLAMHPVIVRSEELHVFLEAEGELSDSQAWTSLHPASAASGLMDSTTRFSKQLFGLERSVLDPVQAVQPTKTTTDLMRALKETAHSMQVTAHADDEVALRRTKESLEEMRDALATASRTAERLVNRMDRQAAVQGDLGLALFKVSKEEENHGSPLANYTGTMRQSSAVIHGCKAVGTALVRVSRVSQKATGTTAQELGTLHEYLGFLPCAIKGLNGREKQLLTHDTLQADIETKKKAIADLEVAGAKVFGGDATKLKRVAELKVDVSKLELSLMAAKAEYEKIKAINIQELAAFHRDSRLDLLHMLQTSGSALVAQAERSLQIWWGLAEELGVSPQEAAAAAKGSPAGSLVTRAAAEAAAAVVASRSARAEKERLLMS